MDVLPGSRTFYPLVGHFTYLGHIWQILSVRCNVGATLQQCATAVSDIAVVAIRLIKSISTAGHSETLRSAVRLITLQCNILKCSVSDNMGRRTYLYHLTSGSDERFDRLAFLYHDKQNITCRRSQMTLSIRFDWLKWNLIHVCMRMTYY